MPLRPGHTRAATRSLIQALLAVVCVGAFAGAASAYDQDASVHGNYRGQCRRLTKQLAYYEKTILPMAIDRGNVAWERATYDQIERLWHKRADLCPKYGKDRAKLQKALDRIRAFNQMLARAGRAAARYFTAGAVP